MRACMAVAAVLFWHASALGAGHAEPGMSPPIRLAQRTCRDVSSCREAVILWCNGYRRADADSDGIPCENVCRSREQVQAIQKEIGC
jgi:hypothetical protein